MFPHRARVLCLCLPLLACARAPSADEIARRGYPAASASASAQGMPTGSRGWPLGQEYPYRLQLSSTVAFGDQPSVIDFDLSGDLLVIPASVAEGITTLFIAVRNASVVSHMADSQEQLAKVAEQVSATGILVTLVNGKLSELRLAPDLATLTVGIYREIASRLQFVPSGADAKKYASDEYDGTGMYTAEYVRTDSQGLHYTKRKLRYASVLGAPTQTALGPAKIVPYVSASEGDFTLSANGRPTEIKVHDEITITGAQTPVRSKNTLMLSAGQPGPGQQHDFAGMAAHLTRVRADQAYSGKTEVAALDSARIHGLTYEQVIDRLKAFSAAHPDVVSGPGQSAVDTAKNQPFVQELSGLFMALSAIFRQQPETIPRALAAVRSHSPLTNTLIDALGSAGTTKAHEALIELSRKSSDPKLRTRSLGALVTTSNPSDTAVSAFRARLAEKPFDEVALYGLGIYARRLRESGHFDQANELATLLVDALDHAGTEPAYLQLALGGIGNCGCEQALPRVTPLLNDGTIGVRVQAVRALQAMYAPEVENLIATSMLKDTSRDVRMTAVETAGSRPEPEDLLMRAASQSALTDTDAHVRYKAVDLVIRWLPRRSDLRATLETVAKNDGEPQVRARAQAAL